ncbi:MAG: hypothetical protein JO296_01130 [Pseudonocardiales bacterium]|jgi:hypothetical protein|nr:hypothetical protein [Pseudonocardiales bacterium]MBV9648726.1 hypothetical protein [Pseudonocardiales bacterium]HZS22392.1 hypothetical protein [Pseudonocardiaceae bacterium]
MSVAESDTVGAAGLDLATGELVGVEPGLKPVVSHHRGKQCSAVALGTDTTGAGWWMEAARI